MIKPGDSILVAVSGGPDSVALLHLLLAWQSEYRLTLIVGHFHHQLRGAASDADARFVQTLAAGLGLPCRVGMGDVRAYARTCGLSLEEAGRILRYDFLCETAQALGAARIAVGHTRDDQAETVLLRLLRGAGTTGLCGIYPLWSVAEGITLIRPLIETERPAVLAFLRERRIAYQEDDSNRDLRFDRNRLRAQLLPCLASDFNPHVVGTLAQHAALAQSEEAWMSQIAKMEADRLLHPREDMIGLEVAELITRPLALQRRLLRLAVQRVKGDLRQIEFAHIEALRGLCAGGMSGKQAHLPGGLVAFREFSCLIVAPMTVLRPPVFSYRLSIPGCVSVPEAACRIKAERVNRSEVAVDCDTTEQTKTALLDAQAVGDMLIVRSRQPGDRCPLGTGESRKVKEILMARKIPRRLRDRIPLVTRPPALNSSSPSATHSARPAEVLWIPGCFLAPPLAATTASDPCIRLTATSLQTPDSGGARD